MRDIRDAVLKGDVKAIARNLRKMKRLWVGKGQDGLLKRRDRAKSRTRQSSLSIPHEMRSHFLHKHFRNRGRRFSTFMGCFRPLVTTTRPSAKSRRVKGCSPELNEPRRTISLRRAQLKRPTGSSCQRLRRASQRAAKVAKRHENRLGRASMRRKSMRARKHKFQEQKNSCQPERKFESASRSLHRVQELRSKAHS